MHEPGDMAWQCDCCGVRAGIAPDPSAFPDQWVKLHMFHNWTSHDVWDLCGLCAGRIQDALAPPFYTTSGSAQTRQT